MGGISRGLYLVKSIIICMDASGQELDEQQAEEKPIGIEEQKTMESQEAETIEEGSAEDVNELPSTTTEEIIGKAQENEQNKLNIKQNIKEKPKGKPRDPSNNLFDQFTKHFQINKVVSSNTTNILKQIQKQLTQVDKSAAISR